MKNLLFVLLLCISGLVFGNATSTESILLEMSNEQKNNSSLIERLSDSLSKNNINIFYSEWMNILAKKCNWVKTNINTELYGQEDKFSDQLCIISEQHTFINQLIYLIKQKNINIIKNPKLDDFKTDSIAQQQSNVYFNYLTETYANKFCRNFNDHESLTNCIDLFISHQFIPEDYGFKITANKAYLLNTPSLEDKTKMYLIEGDKVKLLKRQDSFYLIEYDSQRKGSIKKWLSCSAIDAC